jgi:hypothetical protein
MANVLFLPYAIALDGLQDFQLLAGALRNLLSVTVGNLREYGPDSRRGLARLFATRGSCRVGGCVGTGSVVSPKFPESQRRRDLQLLLPQRRVSV